MGSKHSGVHLRCDDSSAVIAKFRKEFSKKKGLSKKDLMTMEIVKAFAVKNINDITDPQEKAEKEAVLADIMKQAEIDMGAGDPAVIVIREHFVSIYWYDHIRSENLREEMLGYAATHKLPALGVAVYDDANFQLYAVRDVGTEQARGSLGDYLFEYDDITPVSAEEVCDIIDAPFLLDALTKTLSCEDGETMVETFEKETGLPVMMFEEDCIAANLEELYRLPGALIFSAIK